MSGHNIPPSLYKTLRRDKFCTYCVSTPIMDQNSLHKQGSLLEIQSRNRTLLLLFRHPQIPLQRSQRPMPRDRLNVPERYSRIAHLSQCRPAKAVGADPLNPD
jgi:hypothetical protein